ncbi:MAG: hypothetical protein GKR98_01760 [Boseongicola sp.]|nr:MAG: hypothetical protein GKR98_01760 [Boseongicola sp.]
MKLHLAVTTAFLALAACGGQGIADLGDGGGDGGGDPSDTCEGAFVCSGDITAVNLDGAVLEITGLPFDETVLAGTYTLAGAVNGFALYISDDPSAAALLYNAYYETSADGSVTVGQAAVMEGYRSFGYEGTFLRLNDPANLPVAELATYSGQYAGIVLLNGSSDTYNSQGAISFNVDFTDGVINGSTTGRDIITLTSATQELDLIFDDTDIVNGAFTGNALSIDAMGDEFHSGTYSGVFGGTDAETVGGHFIITADEFDGDTEVGSKETGTFIATKD